MKDKEWVELTVPVQGTLLLRLLSSLVQLLFHGLDSGPTLFNNSLQLGRSCTFIRKRLLETGCDKVNLFLIGPCNGRELFRILLNQLQSRNIFAYVAQLHNSFLALGLAILRILDEVPEDFAGARAGFLCFRCLHG